MHVSVARVVRGVLFVGAALLLAEVVSGCALALEVPEHLVLVKSDTGSKSCDTGIPSRTTSY